MNDNEISQMITTDNGYYFIKCVSKLDQEKTDENKTDILVQREQQQFNSDYDEFMESARFDLNKNLWDDVSIADQTGIQTGFLKISEVRKKEDLPYVDGTDVLIIGNGASIPLSDLGKQYANDGGGE